MASNYNLEKQHAKGKFHAIERINNLWNGQKRNSL